MISKAGGLLSNFAVQFLRQRVFSTVAKHMAEYMNKMDPTELEEWGSTNADVLPGLEKMLYERVSQEQLEKWKDVARPYIGCFSADDLPIIIAKVLNKLDAEHASVVQRHADWLHGQLEQAWNKLVEALS